MKPFGYITNSGQFFKRDILDDYAIKNQSQQIKDPFDGQYSIRKVIEPIYNPLTLAKLLELNTYHLRAVRTKARDTAGLGFEITPKEDEQLEENTEQELKYQQVVSMLENLNLPLGITLDRAQTDFEAIGWACVELVRENYDPKGQLVDIVHIPAHTIRRHVDEVRYLQIRGNKKQWFKEVGYEYDVHGTTGQIRPLGQLHPEERATEILFWYNYTPRSDYYGIPDIIPALGAIHGDMSRRDYNISFFNNFGVPAYAVFITGKFDEGDQILDEEGNPTGETELSQTIQKYFSEIAKKPHSALFLTIPGTDVKVEFKPLSVETKEASFRLYREDNRDEILAAHGVPPYRMGIAETGSLGQNVASETTEIYKSSIIEPRQVIIESLFNRHIIHGIFELHTYKFQFIRIDTTDERHEMDMIKDLHSMRAIHVEEIREKYKNRFGLDTDRVMVQADDEELDSMEEVLKNVQGKLLDRVAKDLRGSNANLQRIQHARTNGKIASSNGISKTGTT